MGCGHSQKWKSKLTLRVIVRIRMTMDCQYNGDGSYGYGYPSPGSESPEELQDANGPQNVHSAALLAPVVRKEPPPQHSDTAAWDGCHENHHLRRDVPTNRTGIQSSIVNC